MRPKDTSPVLPLNLAPPTDCPQEVIYSAGLKPRPREKLGISPVKAVAPEVALLPASDVLQLHVGEGSDIAKRTDTVPTTRGPETVFTGNLTRPDCKNGDVHLADTKPPGTPLCANADGSGSARSRPQDKAVTKPEIHSFSRSFAETHSVNEAIILKHLAWKVRKSKNHRDGKAWYYASTQELHSKIPYISASAIDANIRKLEAAGCLQIGNYNKHKYDKTRWFHVPAPYSDEVEEDKISFEVEDARKHEIPGAVLLHNLRHWLKKKLRNSLDANVVHKMSPAELSEHLPYSKGTIKATLAQLVKDGVLVKPSSTKPEYAFPPDQMIELRLKAKLK